MLDPRRIFAVGIALIFGLGVEIVPDLFRTFPAFLKPVLGSSTSLATILVVMLSLLFRIGLKKQSSLELRAGHDHLDEIDQYMDDQGSAWGMRQEVVSRATDAAYEVINNLCLLPLRFPTITLRSSWDELRLDLEIEYTGPAIELADSMPTLEEMGTQTGVAQLAGYLIRQHADQVKVREKNGVCRVQLHFNH
jgi:NCS2 family nucleobase:cation symporter-2